MSFFVVARTSDGFLHLVSSAMFPSRQAAMSALSEATRDFDFPHWDAELLVVDLESAVPVLLVRPSQPQVAEPVIEEPAEASELEESEPVDDLEVAEEPQAVEPPEIVEVLDEVVLIEVVEDPEVIELIVLDEATEVELADEPEIVDLVVAQEVEAAKDAAVVEAGPGIEPDQPEAIEPTTEIESPAEPVSDGALTETAIEVPPAAEPQVEVPSTETKFEKIAMGDAIADEILAELESGELAPGPKVEEEPSFTVSALMAESAIADSVLESEAPADAPIVDEVFGDLVMPAPDGHVEEDDEQPGESELTVSIDERLGLDNSEPAAIPSDLGTWEPAVVEETVGTTLDWAPSPEAAAPGAEEVLAGDGVVIAWPWDTQSDEETAALAEELLADIELVTPPSGPIEDVAEEDIALDSLLVEPAEPVAELTDVVEIVEVLEASADAEEVVVAPSTSAATEAADSVGTSRDEIADFIFDLENVTDIPEAAATETQGGSPDSGPTCAECVYDDTCPNREQRSPQECGSFQWKIP